MWIWGFILTKGHVNGVWTKMEKARPWKPKDGDNCLGGKQGAEADNCCSAPGTVFCRVSWL